MARAITKQEIRRNVLAEWLAATFRFYQAHRARLKACVAAAAVLGLAGGGYWWYQVRQEADAARALAGAYAVLRGEEAGKPDTLEEAVKRLREVTERHRGTRSAEEAQIAAGNLYFESGNVDDALSSYNEYLTGHPRGRFRMMAGLGKAYALEAKGDLQGAVQILSGVIEGDRENPLAGEAYMSLARAYEGLKKPEDAMRIYGEVTERFSQTNWAQQALQRMSILKQE
ncbi:MAG TPA: tetratricopeptide repeat protein [Candidatus Methylomirabilis sp.]|nr:tetratricopeptide repeat protein [Candidatus Methylomirabilis sp.]